MKTYQFIIIEILLDYNGPCFVFPLKKNINAVEHDEHLHLLNAKHKIRLLIGLAVWIGL